MNLNPIGPQSGKQSAKRSRIESNSLNNVKDNEEARRERKLNEALETMDELKDLNEDRKGLQRMFQFIMKFHHNRTIMMIWLVIVLG